MAGTELIRLAGNDLTLIAEVPAAGKSNPRWSQVHFNRAVAEEFFRINPGDTRSLTLERINKQGLFAGRTARPLVYSQRNKNCKVELESAPARNDEYPTDPSTRPLVVMTEINVRTFRYRTLMPGWPGYDEMLELSKTLPTIGRGQRRVLTTLDEVEMRWPGVGLREPRTA